MTFSLACSNCLAGATEQELDACKKALAAGDFSLAVQHAAASTFASNKNREAYLCQFQAYAGLKDGVRAIESLAAADNLSNSPMEHVVTLTLIGNQYLASRQFDKALENYRQSLTLSRENSSRNFQMINLNQIGEALEGKGDNQTALENYLVALKLAANENERADSSGRIAATYSVIGEHDKAIEHQIKAMFLEERSGDFDHYANASLELGRIYTRAGQFANAESTLTKALERIRKAQDPYWEAKGNYYLALAKRGQGDVQGASDLMQAARQLAEKIGATDIVDLIVAASDSASK